MARVSKSVVITAAPERVMEYIAEVSNHPAFIGPLKAVSNLDGDSRRPGTNWDWTFVMAGVEFTGRASTVAYEPGRRFTYRTTTGIESTFTYRVDPSNGGSRLTVEVDYEVPQRLLASVQAAVVERLNDAEGARAVENLKAILDE
jgi:uncharacterized membrane protein